MKVLILGGYGAFGGGLAHLLSDCEGLSLFIAGRTLEKAEAFCGAYQGAAKAVALGLDRKDIAKALATYQPDIVVDASGPFQVYGADPYYVPKACIAAQIHYLDLADATDFVVGVAELDGAAKAKGVTVISGASSCPVITAAILRKLGQDIAVEDVKGGIAPSPYAGIGLNVMKAVLGYAGAPVKLIRNGEKYTAIGLAESLRYTVAPPGYLPLKNLRFSLVEVPDLQILPQIYPNIRNIWMGAGPVPETLLRMLNLCAKARAAFRLPSWEPFAPFFHWVLNKMTFGEHRGGMFVEVTGKKEGQRVTRSWHLVAEGDDGPYIPAMAIEAILRKWMAGTRPAIGARPATNELEIEDYEALFEKKNIYTGYREARYGSVFRELLDDKFEDLPAQIQALHDETTATWQGQARVKTGRNPLAKLAGLLAGVNVKAGNMPVHVRFTETSEGQIWQRRFGERTFKSVFALGEGRNMHLATERFGIIKIGLALILDDDKLFYVPRRAAVLGIPLPRFMVPKGESYEAEKDGKFHFNVTLKLPLIGLIAAYEGWLVKEPAA